jgi:uncharacterized protein YjbI with pentapeptide repeats
MTTCGRRSCQNVRFDHDGRPLSDGLRRDPSSLWFLCFGIVGAGAQGGGCHSAMMSETAPAFERILTTREKSELRGRVFSDCEMIGVDLAGADLRGARFERVLLIKSNLAGADLRGAHFVLCELRFVVLTDTQLGDNRFDGTTLVEVAGLTPEDRRAVERNGGAFQNVRASLR